MDQFKIISCPESYEISGKNIYGELFVQIGDFNFPDNHWGDLVASCISMWLDGSTLLIKSSIQSKNSYFFMDGPHYFVAEKTSEDELSLSFYSYEKLVSIFTGINSHDFFLEISKIAQHILNKIYGHDSQKYNIDTLESHLLSLRRYI